MGLTLLGGFFFGKMWKNMEKRPFFQQVTRMKASLAAGIFFYV